MTQVLLGGEEPIDQNITAAAEFAEAQMKLLQIRKVRLDMLAELERQCHDLQDFSRLVALDRYERLAHTKRRRASNELSRGGKCRVKTNPKRGAAEGTNH